MAKLKALVRYNESFESGFIVDFGFSDKAKVLIRQLKCVKWEFDKDNNGKIIDVSNRTGTYKDVDTGEIIPGGKGLSLWPTKAEAIMAYDNGSCLRG